MTALASTDTLTATGAAIPNLVPPSGLNLPGGAILRSLPTTFTPRPGTTLPHGQERGDTQRDPAVGGSNSERGHRELVAHGAGAPLGSTSAGTAIGESTPICRVRSLLDPLLTLASITLDDLEALRVAQENRYRSLTTTGTSENGVEWGYGLDDQDPQVSQAGAMVDSIKALEHTATLNLQRLMRKHPLGPWVKAQRGVGDKQAARLLGVIGDPYWHSAQDRPRTVSELWAYCGLHTLPARHSTADAQGTSAGGEYNIAARRRKGQQSNWSDEAKKRAWLIATSCLKAGGPYREVYDNRRAKTAQRAHAVECVRCGPSGKPAQPGTHWSPGHQHADALRITSKTILRDLWRESRRVHNAQRSNP